MSSGSIVPGAQESVVPTTADMGSVDSAPEKLNLRPRGLPSNVITTIQSARALSTRELYTYVVVLL